MDAYAFALQIKARFTSSALKDKHTTYKHLKELFKMGDIKLKRCLADAEKYGYIRRDSDMLIANKLYTEFDLVDTLVLKDNAIIPHQEVVKTLRHSIFLNKIKIVQHAADTEKINEEKRIGKTRGKRASTNRLAVCDSEGTYTGFSFGYDKIAEMMDVSIRTAKRDVNELHEKGLIMRRRRFVEFLDKKTTAKLTRREYSVMKSAAMADGKFLYLYDNIVWERQTNSYGLTNPQNIRIYTNPLKRTLGKSANQSRSIEVSGE